jgi:hypothetical protein
MENRIRALERRVFQLEMEVADYAETRMHLERLCHRIKQLELHQSAMESLFDLLYIEGAFAGMTLCSNPNGPDR